ncbi:MAG: hypothetical protein ISS50_06145 [Anaerolineae bacterium]|nr:hypothetical protein [Anaerolineae bacterium]
MRDRQRQGHEHRDRNPFGICTWQDVSRCADCTIAEPLNCRFDWGDLLYFLAGFLPPAMAVVAGMMRGGFGWYLLGWAGYMLFFFFVWEARILCSHCPYWAEGGRVLHCLANYGVIKIWPYHPQPMSTLEKAQFLVGVGIMAIYPFPFLIIGGQYVLALIALAGLVSFAFSLKKHVCTRCVNFSCPANGVPKEIVDAYLRRNPVMRRAWEESGYQLSQQSGG